MPALFRELHTLVPSLRSMFFFADARGGLANVYSESVEHAHITQLYMQEFHGKPGREIPGQSFADAMGSQVGVYDLDAMRVDENQFRRTDYYNLLFRPVGRGSNYIRLVMRDRGRGLGMVTIFRSPGDKHFSQEEKRRLAALEDFFVHALKDQADTDVPLVEREPQRHDHRRSERKTDLSLDDRPRAAVSRHPPRNLAPGSIRIQWNVLPPRLRQLCRDLGRVFSDDDAPPPAYFHRNVLGGFTFRAHWLHGDDPAHRLIAITVSHQEPLPVRLVRQAGELPLTRRQAEVCAPTGERSSARQDRGPAGHQLTHRE